VSSLPAELGIARSNPASVYVGLLLSCKKSGVQAEIGMKVADKRYHRNFIQLTRTKAVWSSWLSRGGQFNDFVNNYAANILK
jgi:hypothetical protein